MASRLCPSNTLLKAGMMLFLVISLTNVRQHAISLQDNAPTGRVQTPTPTPILTYIYNMHDSVNPSNPSAR